ncbi:MAG TPA: hypothetical protein DIW30_00310, partial [Bacteroidales bacterium]|nr:hypothetical protein [Bacteroidales bacterium]
KQASINAFNKNIYAQARPKRALSGYSCRSQQTTPHPKLYPLQAFAVAKLVIILQLHKIIINIHAIRQNKCWAQDIQETPLKQTLIIGHNSLYSTLLV